MTTSVGFLGVGQMGRPMVERLLAAGFPTTFFARRPEVVEEVSAAGATPLPTAPDVAASCDVLIVCLFSDAQLRELLLDGHTTAGMSPGSVLVSHVTGSPALARELAAALPAGVGYVDAPVSGSADDISAGRLTVLAGSSPADLDLARPALESYASEVIAVGGVGNAQIVKLLNNLLFTVHLRMAGAVTELAEAQSIDRPGLVEALHHSSGQSFALDLLAGGPFEATATAAGPYLRKDVAAVRDAAAELGLDLGILGELARWVEEEPN